MAVLIPAPASAASPGQPIHDFTYGGTAPWFVQSAVTHDGIDAWQSGVISSSQSSWMETTVTGPGAIRFWWKVSSESCCDPLAFAIDGNSQANIRGEVNWQKQAFSIPTGSHTLRWTYSTDGSVLTGSNAGWLDQVSFEAGSSIDVAAPVTSAAPAGGMYASSQSVILSCSDNTGCTGTFYCLGSGCSPSTPYIGAIVISAATDLRFYSIDAAGNNEIVKTATYTFDTTPPTTYNFLSAGTYVGQRDVSLSCGDSDIGCAATYYCLGSGCTPSTPYTSAITITASTDLRYYSIDRGGNSEAVKTATYIIMPDTTSPVTTPSSPSGTYGPRYVYLSCNDGNGIGCGSTYYCLGTGCTPSTLLTTSIYISSSTDFRFYSQDKAGNNETVQTVSYVIDQTPPVTTASPSGGSYTLAPLVTLTCSDGTGTGCSSIYYCLGQNCNPSTLYKSPVAINDTTVLRFYSTDVAGNKEAIVTQSYSNPGQAKTIAVPGIYATIQSAIDVAYNGDTVLVAPGTYVENIDFKGKAITVTSSGGPVVTIIDGNRAGSVVSFNGGEESTSVMDGFTIRNGNAGWSSPNYGGGGGVFIRNASPTISNNKIISNTGCSGVGIHVYSGSPVIQGNLIADNQQVGCTTGEGGGGIYLGWASGTQLIDNTISNNKVPGGNGGGIFSNGSCNTLIRGNKILNNTAAGNGGGIAMINTNEPTIIQNVLAGNHAGSSGGGIYWSIPGSAQGIRLVNNTIVANDAVQGSGIFAGGFDANALLINNIVVAKTGPSAIHCEGYYDNLAPQFSHNAVYSAAGNSYDGICTDQNGINGNISADPQLNGPAFGYYGLRPGSPAIDAGDNSAPSLPATDLGGSPRLVDGSGQGQARVDIGAYEFDPDEPQAVVTGAPAGITRETSATITVGGAGIISYRYAIDGGPFCTVDIPVATPITLTGLTGGAHAVAVTGKSSSREQRVTSATVAEWVIDTFPPTTTAAPYGGAFTASQTVTLTCNDNAGSGCADTFYCLGGGCTPDIHYAGPIAVTTTTALRYYSRDAFGNLEEIKTSNYIFVGSISGKVTDSGSGNGIQNVSVTAYAAATGFYKGFGFTDSSGNYRIDGLESGNYKLQFNAFDYVEQWYDCKSSLAAATTVAVTAPDSTANINTALAKGGSITGTVTDKTTGAAIQGVYVDAYDAVSGSLVGNSGYSDSSGVYRVSGLATGSYKLRFHSTDYVEQWYDGKSSQAAATTVAVTAPDSTAGINMTLVKKGAITGTVTDKTTGAAIQGVYVNAYDAVSGSWLGYYSGYSDSSGAYRISGLPTGTYKLRFTAPGYVSQWYDGKSSQATATTVAVTAPDSTANINTALAKGGAITGTVTDKTTGAAIQGVSVDVYNAVSGPWLGYSGYSGYSDSSGAYKVSGLPTGTYKLRFTAPGYVSQWYDGKINQTAATTVAVTAPDSTASINVALAKGAAITGTVTDKTTGAAIPGVSVDVYDAVSGWLGYSGYSDSSGNYRVSGLATGNYKLKFSSTDYVEQWYDGKTSQAAATMIAVTAPNVSTGINVALAKGAVITGTVTDKATGAAIQGEGVSYVNAFDAVTGLPVGFGITNSSGVYTITGLPTGNYKLKFNASGYVEQWYDGTSSQTSATTVAVTAPNVSSGINMALAKGGVITGTVTDKATGAAIQRVSVFAYDAVTGSPVLSSFSESDSSGAYRVSGLPTGNFKLHFRATGYLEQWYDDKASRSAATMVAVTAPDSTDHVNMALNKGASISGVITDHSTGVGITGADIYVTDRSTGSMVASGQSDPDGRYTVPGLASGSYRLIVVPVSGSGYIGKMYGAPCADTVSVTAPNDIAGIDVSLDMGGSISGRVSDAATGAGISGVSITLTNTSADTGAVRSNTIVEPTGFYTIGDLPSGEYSLSFSAPGYVGMTSPIAVRIVAPDASTGIDATLTRGGGISGRITGSLTGEGIGEIVVTAVHSQTLAWAGSSVSDATGSYVVSGLPNGSYNLYFDMRNVDAHWRGHGLIYSESANSLIVSHYVPLTPALDTPGLPVSLSMPENLPVLFPPTSQAHLASLGHPVTVAAPGITTGIDMNIDPPGSINGRVTDSASGVPLSWIYVVAYDGATGARAISTTTNGEGRYTINGLKNGRYRIKFSSMDFVNGGYLSSWYGGGTAFEGAADVTVQTPDTTTGIDMQLFKAGGISGSISADSCPGPRQVTIKAYDAASGALAGQTTMDTNRTDLFTIPTLPAGNYKLAITPAGSGFVRQWYPNRMEETSAGVITVVAGQFTAGIDVTLASGGGSIFGKISGNTTGTFMQASVKLYDWNTGGLVADTAVTPDGNYQFTGLPDARYKLLVIINNLNRWYRTADETAEASPITVSSGTSVTGIDLSVPYMSATTGMATSISATGAMLNGTINDSSENTFVTFDYGLTSGYGNSVTVGTVTAGNGGTAASAAITGLACNTIHHFRVAGKNSSGTAYGPDQSFTTAACPVSGVCGTSNGGLFKTAPLSNLCTAGTPATAAEGAGSTWNWICTGINGGSTTTCTASRTVPAAPQLSISTMANGSFTNIATLNIAGTVSAEAGIKSLTVNGTPVSVGADGAFSTAITLQQGANGITTVAIDNVNQQTSDSRTITYDNAVPAVSITAPADNCVVSHDWVTVTGTVSETGTIQATVNGGSPQSAALTGTDFTVTVNLAAGTNTIVITAIDLAGNSATTKRTIDSNTSKPTLAVTDPNQDITTHQSSYLLTGNAGTADNAVTLMLAFDGQTFTPAVTNGTFAQQLAFTTEKQYAITVTATDKSGNYATVQRNIVYAKAAVSGDLNGDGTVDIADALLALQMALGLVTATSTDLARGDVGPLVNGKPAPDGRIDIADAVLILEKSVGMISW